MVARTDGRKTALLGAALAAVLVAGILPAGAQDPPDHLASKPAGLTGIVANTTAELDPSIADTTGRPVVVRMLRQVDDVTPGGPQVSPINSDLGDCGYSEEMPDRWVLWFFCDSGRTSPPNDSVAGIASSTSPGNPTLGTSRYLGAPTVTCTRGGRAVRWMTGVTSYPAIASDQTVVVIFFLQGCTNTLGADHHAVDWDPGSTGIATAVYTTGSHAVPAATVHDAALWEGQLASGRHWALHGDGATTDDSYVYAYACHPWDRPEGPSGTHGSGQCTIARGASDASTPANLANLTRWTYWSGTNWLSCPDDCDDSDLESVLARRAWIDLPPRARTIDWAVFPLHFQVAYSPQLEMYVSAHQRKAFEPHMQIRIRVAERPEGPWSRPIDVPVKCDGTVRPGPLFNCYQEAFHPGITTSAGDLTFGYYDRFQGSSASPQFESIRFLRMSLCVVKPPGTTSRWVIDRCLMADAGWGSSDTVSRLEATAIMWRLGGHETQTIDTSVSAVPRRYREAAHYVLHDPIYDYTEVWDAVTDLTATEPAQRGELVRLLWQQSRDTSEYPDPDISDWDDGWSGPLKSALRWAYATGVVCAGRFAPTRDARRSVAAEWLYQAQTADECSGSI